MVQRKCGKKFARMGGRFQSDWISKSERECWLPPMARICVLNDGCGGVSCEKGWGTLGCDGFLRRRWCFRAWRYLGLVEVYPDNRQISYFHSK